MLDAAGEAIESRHQHHIELPVAGIVHQTIQRRSAVLAAGDTFVSVLFNNLQAAMCAYSRRASACVSVVWQWFLVLILKYSAVRLVFMTLLHFVRSGVLPHSCRAIVI